MKSLAGAAEAGERLQRTALRDFGPPVDSEDRAGTSYKMRLSPHDVPVPRLLEYALNLIGLKSHGPGEKVAWWIDFTFRGDSCQLSHEKFGVRLYLTTEDPEDEAHKTLVLVAKKLRSAVQIIERLVLAAAPDLLGTGDVTVLNQHSSLDRAYRYFRERAASPTPVADEYETHEVPGLGSATSFRSGSIQMTLNSFHDLVAAITAYVSRLEHDLVLALAFTNFDPAADVLTGIIGSRWGEKFERVLGKGTVAAGHRARLADVVERWRNPYAHGGFEKGHGATVYLHVPGVGAVPVGMTNVRNSPHFSFLPANETDITEVFALLDEIDGWLDTQLPHAMAWARSGLPVRFDLDFSSDAQGAQTAGRFDEWLDHEAYRQDQVDNMDY